MEYIYETYGLGGNRIDVCSRFIDAENFFDKEKHFEVRVYKGGNSSPIAILRDEEDWSAFREMLEKVSAWKPKKKEWDPFAPLGDGTPFKKDDLSRTFESKLKADKLADLVKKDPINPAHHKNYMTIPNGPTLQWIEAMSLLPRFRDDPISFRGAIELQVRKYLDRQGRKDNPLQELEKALWYLKYLVAMVKNDDIPVKVKDIDAFINHKCQ